MPHPPLRFGIFLAPFHPVREDPTGCLDRDLELVKWLDLLRYDEAWIGEHHSAGYEIIGSPEIFLAIASQHTRHIRLGTGVISVPYHHPFMIAERIVQLDHMTRGRVMFGSGPGALQSDARMLGLEAVCPTRIGVDLPVHAQHAEALEAGGAEREQPRAVLPGDACAGGRDLRRHRVLQVPAPWAQLQPRVDQAEPAAFV